MFRFPFSAFEKQSGRNRQNRKRNRDRPENAVRSEIEMIRQQICERNFKQPENEQIQVSRRPCIARAVECGFENHSETVKNKAVSDDPQTIRAVSQNRRFFGKNPTICARKI